MLASVVLPSGPISISSCSDLYCLHARVHVRQLSTTPGLLLPLILFASFWFRGCVSFCSDSMLCLFIFLQSEFPPLCLQIDELSADFNAQLLFDLPFACTVAFSWKKKQERRILYWRMHSHTLSLSFASKWRQMQLLSPVRDEEEAHDKECWVTARNPLNRLFKYKTSTVRPLYRHY